jgi:hypothetical protein
MKALSSVLVLAILLSVPLLAADEASQSPAVGKTVTLEGSIESFDSADKSGPASLVLRDGKGRLHTVWLSPRRLVERQRLNLAAGHLVRIQGTVCARGFVAQRLEDRTAGQTVTLRDAKGTPCWRGGSQRGGQAGMGRHHRGRAYGNCWRGRGRS